MMKEYMGVGKRSPPVEDWLNPHGLPHDLNGFPAQPLAEHLIRERAEFRASENHGHQGLRTVVWKVGGNRKATERCDIERRRGQ